ncbi:biotin--[acetyl-CoA-carboxylase] ligase [Bifidobacterium xylocopae]|nr:biotin--[acetyl-CoA-carboxylase] ligase [Bifidobacterium xylocopae]
MPWATFPCLGSTNTLLSGLIAMSDRRAAADRVVHVFDGMDESGDEAAGGPTRSSLKVVPLRSEAGIGMTVPISLALADRQNQGRGRLDRVWYNQPGESFMASWAAALPTRILSGARGGWLPMAVGLALAHGLDEVLHDCGAEPLDGSDGPVGLSLKWPNDLFRRGRKLAGVLCEFVPVDERESVLVAGVGLNLFVPADRLPTELAGSLQLEYGPLPAYGGLRDRLALAVSAELARSLTRLVEGGDEAYADLRREVMAHSWTLGRQVEINPVSGDPVRGRAVGLNTDASLEVELDGGGRFAVTTGDVGVLPETGGGAEAA